MSALSKVPLTATQGDKVSANVPVSMSEKALGKASSSVASDGDKTFQCPDCGKKYKTGSGMRYHYQSTDCSGHECITCGKDHFHTRKGMKIHHKEMHGESIAGEFVECAWCGDEKRVPNHHVDKYKNHFCNNSECKAEWIRENIGGDDHVLAKRITKQCAECGSDITRPQSAFGHNAFCDYDCEGAWLSKNNVGENHPNWKGGREQIVYGAGWRKQRQIAYERDGGCCVVCGIEDSESATIDVHHIRHVESFETRREAHKLNNLVTLCRKHHKRWEGIPLRPDVEHL